MKVFAQKNIYMEKKILLPIQCTQFKIVVKCLMAFTSTASIIFTAFKDFNHDDLQISTGIP